MTTLVVAGPSGLSEHDGGARHPERPSRLVAVMDGVRALGPEHEVVPLVFHEASMDELARVHDRDYLARLASFCAAGGGDIDADTYARPDSWAAARRGRGPVWPRWVSSTSAARASPSSPSGHPAITPPPTAPWGSASSTTWP